MLKRQLFWNNFPNSLFAQNCISICSIRILAWLLDTPRFLYASQLSFTFSLGSFYFLVFLSFAATQHDIYCFCVCVSHPTDQLYTTKWKQTWPDYIKLNQTNPNNFTKPNQLNKLDQWLKELIGLWLACTSELIKITTYRQCLQSA